MYWPESTAGPRTPFGPGEALGAILKKIERQAVGAWTELCILLYDNYEVLFDAKKRSSATSGAIASLGAEAVWYNDFDSTYLLVMSKCFATDLSAAWVRWREFVTKFATWVDGAAVRELSVVTFDEMVRLAAKLLRTDETVRQEERSRFGPFSWMNFRIPIPCNWNC